MVRSRLCKKGGLIGHPLNMRGGGGLAACHFINHVFSKLALKTFVVHSNMIFSHGKSHQAVRKRVNGCLSVSP